MSQNEITQAEITASIIEGRGQSTFAGATKVISLRLPITLEAELQAFAHKSGKTQWNGCNAFGIGHGAGQAALI